VKCPLFTASEIMYQVGYNDERSFRRSLNVIVDCLPSNTAQNLKCDSRNITFNEEAPGNDKTNLSMIVAVMKIRHMRVTMNRRLVSVPMSMRFSGWIGRQVLMLMMFIVTMSMLVFQGFM
jgi:hypothetical protein